MQVSIRAMRVHRGMTQAEAAKALGVAQGTLVRWESGTSSMDLNHFEAMCRLYNCSRDDIFLPVMST